MIDDNDYFEHSCLTDEEISKLQSTLTIEDNYPFTCIKSVNKMTEYGNNLELTLKLWDKEGKEYIQMAWLDASPRGAWKVKHYWESVGHPEKYKSKNHVKDYEDKSGIVKITMKKDKKGISRPFAYDFIVSNFKPPIEMISKESKDPWDDDIAF